MHHRISQEIVNKFKLIIASFMYLYETEMGGRMRKIRNTISINVKINSF